MTFLLGFYRLYKLYKGTRIACNKEEDLFIKPTRKNKNLKSAKYYRLFLGF